MNSVRVAIEIGAHEVSVQLPLHVVQFADRPHTKHLKNLEEAIEKATTQALAALGIERQS